MRALALLSTTVGLIAAATAASAGGGQAEDGVTLSVRPLINPQMVWARWQWQCGPEGH
jgi:Spy/CpxP family protein refolding chaperone